MAVVVFIEAMVDDTTLESLLVGAGWRIHRGDLDSEASGGGQCSGSEDIDCWRAHAWRDHAILINVALGGSALDLRRLVAREKHRGFKVFLIVPPPADPRGREILLEAFRAGADEFLTTAAVDGELLLRLDALLSRCRARSEGSPQTHAGIEFDRRSRRLSYDGKNISLTPCESCIFACLSRRPGQVISRTLVQRQLARASRSPSRGMVDLYILYLRRKLQMVAPHYVIRTVRGVGFALVYQTPLPSGQQVALSPDDGARDAAAS